MRPAEFDEVIKQAIKGFVAELSPEQLQFSRIDPQEFSRHVDEFYAHYNDSQGDILHEGLMVDIASLLLDKKSRYDALRGFIEPLAKYISLSKEEKRHGTHIGEGEGSGDQQTGPNQPGGNTEQALMNLADLLNPDERNELLSQVANNPGGSQAGNAQKDKRLSKLASDEYYKRNVPEINIRSPNYEAVTIDLGKKRVPFLVSSERILTQDVPNLPLEKILEFQEQTGLAQLFQISDFEFQFDHYEWQEVQDVDYSFENTGLDLPANIIFHVDSSGSMGSRNYVSTGCKYDVLMHVCYGMLKTLRKASKEMNTPVQVISANFSNGTILSKPVELSHMYDTPNNEAKDVLTGFQAGGTEYTPAAFKDIEKMLQPGKTVHIWITDGDLTGQVDETFRAIESTVQRPDTSFLYFETGGAGSFGGRVQNLSRNNPNVQYFPNVTIDAIQNKALEVILQYQEGTSYTQVI